MLLTRQLNKLLNILTASVLLWKLLPLGNLKVINSQEINVPGSFGGKPPTDATGQTTTL